MTAPQISINEVTDSGVVQTRVILCPRFNANSGAVQVLEPLTHFGG
jgi:hypothetical protein